MFGTFGVDYKIIQIFKCLGSSTVVRTKSVIKGIKNSVQSCNHSGTISNPEEINMKSAY